MFEIDEQPHHELIVITTLYEPRQVQVHPGSNTASSLYWGFTGHVAGTETGQTTGIGNLSEPCEGFNAEAQFWAIEL